MKYMLTQVLMLCLAMQNAVAAVAFDPVNKDSISAEGVVGATKVTSCIFMAAPLVESSSGQVFFKVKTNVANMPDIQVVLSKDLYPLRGGLGHFNSDNGYLVYFRGTRWPVSTYNAYRRNVTSNGYDEDYVEVEVIDDLSQVGSVLARKESVIGDATGPQKRTLVYDFQCKFKMEEF